MLAFWAVKVSLVSLGRDGDEALKAYGIERAISVRTVDKFLAVFRTRSHLLVVGTRQYWGFVAGMDTGSPKSRSIAAKSIGGKE